MVGFMGQPSMERHSLPKNEDIFAEFHRKPASNSPFIPSASLPEAPKDSPAAQWLRRAVSNKSLKIGRFEIPHFLMRLFFTFLADSNSNPKRKI